MNLKKNKVPGMHPPPYDKALFDPTEPPRYARPPSVSTDASGQYGEINRTEQKYPDFNSEIYDIGGIMSTECAPVIPPPVPLRKKKSVEIISEVSFSSRLGWEIGFQYIKLKNDYLSCFC